MPELKLLEVINPTIPPGGFTKEYVELVPYSKRSIDLWSLRQGLTPKQIHECIWCRSNVITDSRRIYCNPDCSNSAYFYCYPQKPSVKAWLLIHRQEFCCLGCGESHEDFIRKRILKKEKIYQDYGWKHAITYHSIGYGIKFDVDHVIPIFKGGRGISLDNVQVLCRDCHKIKTAQERAK